MVIACLFQISALQDTPELLGFLRNTSTPSPRRHKRSISTTPSYSRKTLVRLTYVHLETHPSGH